MPKDGVGRGHSGHLRARRATRSSSASRSAWPKRAARATSSSASTRSIIRAIPIAGRSSSPRSSGWPTSRPRPGSRARRFTIHAPLQHMTKADIAREAERLGLDAGAQPQLLRSRAGRRAIAASATPAGCAPRASPRRAARSDPYGLRMTYAVKECFLTLQGEGVQAGSRAVFLRFAGCNLWSGREAGPGDGAVQFLRHRFRRHRRRGRRQVRRAPTRWPPMSRRCGARSASGGWS